MSHWKPSRLAAADLVTPVYATPGQQPTGGSPTRGFPSGRATSGFRTDAEDPAAVSPFLLHNMQRDYQQRHLQERPYLVLAGGETFYHTRVDLAHREALPIPERLCAPPTQQGGLPPLDLPRVRAVAPSRAEHMGHVPKNVR